MSDKTILVAVKLPHQSKLEIQEHLTELHQLVTTLDYEVLDALIINRQKINPATFIGRGKLQEIKSIIDWIKTKV